MRARPHITPPPSRVSRLSSLTNCKGCAGSTLLRWGNRGFPGSPPLRRFLPRLADQTRKVQWQIAAMVSDPHNRVRAVALLRRRLFFLVELVLRIKRAGWRWLRQPWNLLDAGIINLALIPVVGDSITILRVARGARVVHLSRH